MKNEMNKIHICTKNYFFCRNSSLTKYVSLDLGYIVWTTLTV